MNYNNNLHDAKATITTPRQVSPLCLGTSDTACLNTLKYTKILILDK